MPKTDEEQCVRVDKNVGPAARCRSEEIRGVCVKVLKQRMAFCNFPLAAAERCERVNVDVYAPRNMRNVIDSMAEINTYCKLLLFSFFFCKDGSDRLMKRASYSCCNFLCVVLAAAYLKYRRCCLSCLPFVWHFFFHCDAHTQVDCNMCRFSKLLLFSFLFCKDGSDRLMKRASYSCCNFLCVVVAAAYLKYRRCHLSCLPFVWHFFSL